MSLRILLALACCLGLMAEDGDARLRVIGYNVYVGFKNDEPRRQAVSTWLAAQKPDVVALMELNGYDEARLRREAAAWGHAHAVLLKTDGYPTGLTSRAPITDAQRVIDGFHHGVIRARTHGIVFYVLHLSPLDDRVRLREAAQILDGHAPKQGRPLTGALASQSEAPVVLIGDFNALSPADRIWYDGSGVLERTRALDAKPGRSNLDDAGALDYRTMERFAAAGLVDVVRARDPTSGAGLSYPTPLEDPALAPDARRRIQQRIDYLLASPELARACTRAEIVATPALDACSDHYPLVAEFDWPMDRR